MTIDNLYETGVDFYQNKIADATAKLADTVSGYDRLVLNEDIETWKLRLEQNRRRSLLVRGLVTVDQLVDMDKLI